MASDASLPPNAPRVNTSVTDHTVAAATRGEEDASVNTAPTLHTTDPDTKLQPTKTVASVADDTTASLRAPPPSLEVVCRDIHRRVSAFLKRRPESDLVRRVQEQTKISLGVIEKALQDYEFASLSLSYNGGKDCLVLLILYLSALYTHFKRFSSSASSSSLPSSSSSCATPPAPSSSLTSSSSSPSPPPRPSSSSETGGSTCEPESRSSFPTSIPSIYAQSPDPFESMTNFVTTSAKRYHLDLFVIRTDPKPTQLHNLHLKNNDLNNNNNNDDTDNTDENHPTEPSQPRITFRDAFSIYLTDHNAQHKTPIRAIFVGTRRTDPHGANLTHFDRTDHGWPDFMRVHPVIDWRLREIWTFLRADELREPSSGHKGDRGGSSSSSTSSSTSSTSISTRNSRPASDNPAGANKTAAAAPRGSLLPYCNMYDQGYTSLGGVGDTKKNPRLRYLDENGREKFRPAYELTDDEEERLGRM